MYSTFALFALIINFPHLTSARPNPRYKYAKYVDRELDYLARLGSRRTGSSTHNKLIRHIEDELNCLNLPVYSDTWYFDHDDSSLNPAKLNVAGQVIEVASAVPYSGHTTSESTSGPLVDLRGEEDVIPWEKAKGSIAVLNITNSQGDRSRTLPLWPGSTEWEDKPSTGVPASIANSVVTNLAAAKAAGVKAVVYVWDNISDELAKGQYGPFHHLYFDIPALYVSGASGATVLAAAKSETQANVILEGKIVPNTSTRNIWTIIPGEEKAEESVIINTHTDGTNLIEDNGHIALLAYARELIRKKPKRTTILAFITAHIRSGPFTNTKRATSRWLADHTNLWNASSSNGYQAVFASCVEHLGAISYVEDIESNTYTRTNNTEEELIYASTSALAKLTFETWHGADPGITRVINPTISGEQPGEGLPFLKAGIPEISLITAPSYLLKEYPKSFNERQLVDLAATLRQINSFIEMWRRADDMDVEAFGKY